ncbi:enoyl-CoA hydratase/isomerase family protein [Thalassotalea ganghwensis]
MENLPVKFSSLLAQNGKYLAIASLDSAKSLNALSLTMVELLLAQLTTWLDDSDVAVIILQSESDKAFCAGGDVVGICRYLLAEHNATVGHDKHSELKAQKLAKQFFTLEYQLDQLVHNAKKPIMVWAHGYVMGGGIGLIAGASHKIVTPQTIMAMPEVSIGLYPDVGASWFLNQMPSGVGMFLALTGMTFTGQEAIHLGLGGYYLSRNDKQPLLDKLLCQPWTLTSSDHQLLSNVIAEHQLDEHTPIVFEQYPSFFTDLSNCQTPLEAYQTIIEQSPKTEWFTKAIEKMVNGSPLSIHIIFRQLIKCQTLSLAQCFDSELRLSTKCCQKSDFAEGVRALLIDKDKTPQWLFSDIKQIKAEDVDWYFQ